jgi:hypothetical protein
VYRIFLPKSKGELRDYMSPFFRVYVSACLKRLNVLSFVYRSSLNMAAPRPNCTVVEQRIVIIFFYVQMALKHLKFMGEFLYSTMNIA